MYRFCLKNLSPVCRTCPFNGGQAPFTPRLTRRTIAAGVAVANSSETLRKKNRYCSPAVRTHAHAHGAPSRGHAAVRMIHSPSLSQCVFSTALPLFSLRICCVGAMVIPTASACSLPSAKMAT